MDISFRDKDLEIINISNSEIWIKRATGAMISNGFLLTPIETEEKNR
jgi:hypothetical protein